MTGPAQKIESICGSKMSDDEPPSWFKVGNSWMQFVGYDGTVDEGGGVVREKPLYRPHVVTAIRHEEQNRGDHGVGWFLVFAGDVLIASLNERGVAEVYYEIPPPPGA